MTRKPFGRRACIRRTYALATAASLICVTRAVCRMFSASVGRGRRKGHSWLFCILRGVLGIAQHLVAATRKRDSHHVGHAATACPPERPERRASDPRAPPQARQATRRSCSGAGRLAVERRRGDRAAALARPDRDRPDRAAGARPALLRQLPRPLRRRQRVRCGDPLARSAAQLLRLRRPPGQRARHLQAYRRRAGEAAAARRARLQGGAASGIAAGRTVPAAHRRSGAAAALARGPGDGGCRACGARTVPGGRWLAGGRFARPDRRAAAVGRGCRSAGAAAASRVAPPGTVARRCAAAGGTRSRRARGSRPRSRQARRPSTCCTIRCCPISARACCTSRSASARCWPTTWVSARRSRRSPPPNCCAGCTGVARVLVVCPASLKGEWQEQIARFSGAATLLVTGPPSGAARAVRAARLLHRRELRAGRHRRRRHQPDAAARHRHSRRGAADQELAHQDGARGEVAARRPTRSCSPARRSRTASTRSIRSCSTSIPGCSVRCSASIAISTISTNAAVRSATRTSTS